MAICGADSVLSRFFELFVEKFVELGTRFMQFVRCTSSCWKVVVRDIEDAKREGLFASPCTFMDVRSCRGFFFQMQEASKVKGTVHDRLGRTSRIAQSTPKVSNRT